MVEYCPVLVLGLLPLYGERRNLFFEVGRQR